MNKNIYLLYGEENHLINKEIENIIKHFLGNDIENKIIKYDMIENNISSAIDDLTSISLFSDSKIIICNNCYFLTGSNEGDINHNTDYLMNVVDKSLDNILILVVNNAKLDERKKIVKELKKRVNTKCFLKLKKDEIIKYVLDEFKKDKYDINTKTINLFLDIVGNDLDIIYNEIEKLKLYKYDEKIINDKDVDNISSRMLNDNIFELVDAVVNRNIEKSLELYDDLLLMNEEEIKLIIIIANQFRLIYQTKNMCKSGYSEFDIAKQLEVHPYRIKLANEIRIDENKALDYLYRLSELDINIKNGIVDKSIAFEMFLLNI